MSFSSIMGLFILLSSSCTKLGDRTYWFNPLNVCTLYIKCCHTFQLPFSCCIIVFVCICICLHASEHVWICLCLSEQCRQGKITPKILHCNNSAGSHTSLFCDLLKDLFLCWLSTFLLKPTLEALFWFNTKINYLGVLVCFVYSCTSHWRWVDSASNESFGTRCG